jgi:hypothetical protein
MNRKAVATKDEYGEDQRLLADIFWPIVKGDAAKSFKSPKNHQNVSRHFALNVI